MPKPQRPWATFAFSVVALFAALFLEWEMGRAPHLAGFSLVAALPLLALGFGIDWLRLTRPPPSHAAFVIALALTTAALPFTLMSERGRVFIVVAGGAFILVAVVAHVRAVWLGHVVEATYVGQRGKRSVFINAQTCWALYCEEAFSMRAGDSVAFRFVGQDHETNDGPFREHSQVHGRVKEIAESKGALRQKRKRSARWLTRAVALATGAAMLELGLLAFFVVF